MSDTPNNAENDWLAHLRSALSDASRQLVVAHCESSEAVAGVMAAIAEVGDSEEAQRALLSPCQSFDRISQRLVGTERLLADIAALLADPNRREQAADWAAISFKAPEAAAQQGPAEIEMF